MERVHGIEIHELEGCPPGLRDGVTDVLAVGMRLLGLHAVIAPVLAAAMRHTGDRAIVDLCAGGTGAWASLHPALVGALGAPVTVVFTDLRPSEEGRRRVEGADEPSWVYGATSVDARAVPPELVGFRTVFNAFHHFQPGEATGILADAVACGEGVLVVETLSRTPRDLIHSVVLGAGTPVFSLLASPWSWRRLFWTFVVPLLPAVIVFDAVVSCLRTHDRASLDAMIASIPSDGYTWSHGRAPLRFGLATAHWLIGVPRAGKPVLD